MHTPHLSQCRFPPPGCQARRRAVSQISPARLFFLLLVSILAGQAAPLQATVPSTVERQLGNRYSPLGQIDLENIGQLELAWVAHTGETDTTRNALVAFEDEPSLIDGSLVVCTPSRRLIALDPANGNERWTFDPESQGLTKKCRGINAWVDEKAPQDAHCKTRIFLGTPDYRLFAISSRDGKPCADFGEAGVIQMEASKEQEMPGELGATSKPAIVNGVVVVGSFVLDNHRLDAPSGRVLAFDARTGEPRWQFDPVPRDRSDPAYKTWLKGPGRFGGGNVWSSMAVDDSLDLVYLPTTAPSIDYYGGERPGANEYTNSVVALRGTTGEVVWHFQLVHHDIWDYEPPAQPLLIDYPHDGRPVPALVQLNKTGLIYIFDRATGEPLVPVVERPVPREGAVDGEWLSPTQPFPEGMPAVSPQGITPDDAWGFTPLDTWLCRNKIAEFQHGPLYTPPSTRGTIFQPGPAGGPNWGGGSFDPESKLLVVPSNRVPFILTLIPREHADLDADPVLESRSSMQFPNKGAPYVTRMDPLLSPLGAPCTAPPWAALTAVNLVEKKIAWEVPLGTIEKLAPVPIPWKLGAPGAGGALITAGGLVFVGYTNDDTFKALNLRTGDTVWETELPASGMATPVSYQVDSRQYIVIAAGGHSLYQGTMGDSVVAFRLKQ